MQIPRAIKCEEGMKNTTLLQRCKNLALHSFVEITTTATTSIRLSSYERWWIEKNLFGKVACEISSDFLNVGGAAREKELSSGVLRNITEQEQLYGVQTRHK